MRACGNKVNPKELNKCNSLILLIYTSILKVVRRSIRIGQLGRHQWDVSQFVMLPTDLHIVRDYLPITKALDSSNDTMMDFSIFNTDKLDFLQIELKKSHNLSAYVKMFFPKSPFSVSV